MEPEVRKESIKNEITIDFENLLDLIISELRKGTKESEKVVEQLIRDTLNEKLFLER